MTTVASNLTQPLLHRVKLQRDQRCGRTDQSQVSAVMHTNVVVRKSLLLEPGINVVDLCEIGF